MINFNEQLEFFKLIGDSLKKKIECFAIGGSAMMFYNAKVETKDVDLVFMKGDDLKEIKERLYDIGFKEKETIVKVFKKHKIAKNKPVMMVRGEERFDLFLKEVISFKMSNSVIERVKETHEFGNLFIKIVSPEDIILLKCATEREKDRYDAVNLLEKFNINWDIVIEESIYQAKVTPYLFPVFLFDFLYELKEDLKADVPKEVIDKVRGIGEEMMINRLKKRK